MRIAKESECEFVEDEYGTEIYVEYEDVSKKINKLRHLAKIESDKTARNYFQLCLKQQKKASGFPTPEQTVGFLLEKMKVTAHMSFQQQRLEAK